MSERFADLVAREAGVRDLGAVLNSVRSIAASRAQQAREALRAVDRYSAELVGALGTVLALMPGESEDAPAGGRAARVVFGAEEGFAGAFSERVLAGIDDTASLFLVGTRAASVAAEHGLHPVWTAAMSGRVAGIPKLADRIAAALYEKIAGGEIDRLEVRYPSFRGGAPFEICTEQLLPLDAATLRGADGHPLPLIELPADEIFRAIGSDYVQARLCRAALHAFAAENEARVAAMANARREIERHLESLGGEIRRVRQEQITAEIIELSSTA